MINNRVLRIGVPLFLLLVVFATIPFSLIIAQRGATQWRPATVSRAVLELSPEFREIWQQSPMFADAYRSRSSIFLGANADNAYLLGSTDQFQPEAVLSLDPSSGEVKWRTTANQILFRADGSTLAVNSDHVYVGYPGTQKVSGDTAWGAAKIVAYQATSGKQVWSRTIGGARSIDTIIATDSFISVDGSFSAYYYFLDAQTGEVVEKRRKGDGFPWLFLDGDLWYFRQQINSLQAVDISTGRIIWGQLLNLDIYQPPTLSDDIIFFVTGQTIGRVIALERFTGKILWQYPAALSNVATSDSTAFFLTDEAKLLAVDVQSGTVLGWIQFSPAIVDDYTNYAFRIAASGDIILVYLGDGRQMFAFRFHRTK